MKKYLVIFTVAICNLLMQVSQASNELYVVYTYDNKALEKTLQAFGKEAGVELKIEFMYQDDAKYRMMSMMELRKVDVMIIPADQVSLYSLAKYSEINPSLFKTKFPERKPLWN